MMDGHAEQPDGDEDDKSSGEESDEVRRPKRRRQPFGANWRE